jgi:hypothetical protein
MSARYIRFGAKVSKGNSKSQAPNSKQIQNPKSLNKSTIDNRQSTIDNPPSVLPSSSLTVLLKGVTNKINSIWVVGNGTKLEQTTWLKPWWSGNPGLIEISIPEESLDAEMTVIAVLLDGKLLLKF